MYSFGIKSNFWLEHELELHEGPYTKRAKIVPSFWYYVNPLHTNAKIKHACPLCKNWHVILKGPNWYPSNIKYIVPLKCHNKREWVCIRLITQVAGGDGHHSRPHVVSWTPGRGGGRGGDWPATPGYPPEGLPGHTRLPYR